MSFQISSFRVISVISRQFTFTIIVGLDVRGGHPVSKGNSSSKVGLLLVGIGVYNGLVGFVRVNILRVCRHAIPRTVMTTIPTVKVRRHASLIRQRFINCQQGLGRVQISKRSSLRYETT